MKCRNCGKDYEGRANSTYCSAKCKQEAYRKRNSNLTQSVVVYKQPTSSVRNVDSKLVSSVTNGVINGVSDGFGHNVQRGLNDMFNISNSPFYTLTISATAGLGAYVGYSYSKKGKKLANSIIGAGVGFAVGQLAYTIVNQFTEYLNQKREIVLEQQEIAQQLGNNAKVLSSNDVIYMNVPSIQISGIWGDFLGYNLNYNFSFMVYGSPGGGKSHFCTILSGYFETIGKVLYVLAEEGITSSVKERIKKYNLKNTDFMVTRSQDEVFAVAEQYKFVFIDSINGMVNYNNHNEFIQKLKHKNLYGTVIVNQVNKDGKFTGKNEVLHEIDTEILVEDGVAQTLKNRFDQHAPKTINIFPNKHRVAENISKSITIIGN